MFDLRHKTVMSEGQGDRNSQISLQQHYFTFSITCVGFQVMEVRGHQRSKVQRSRSFQSHRSKHFHLPCSVSVRNVESSNKALVI